MIFVKTHNGARPYGTLRTEILTNCQPSQKKAYWLHHDSKHQERVIVINFDCHRCVAHQYTGVLRLRPIK